MKNAANIPPKLKAIMTLKNGTQVLESDVREVRRTYDVGDTDKTLSHLARLSDDARTLARQADELHEEIAKFGLSHER